MNQRRRLKKLNKILKKVKSHTIHYGHIVDKEEIIKTLETIDYIYNAKTNRFE